ncbi:MAG: methyl-accepting chemotaxis protein [Pirellulales bacterium]|nr:methyl-accepting chemotaxis protein [Pirellulales bacterium]
MKNLRLRVKLGLIVGILVLSVVAVALAGYLELGALNRRVEQMVEQTSKAAYLVGELWSNAQRARRLEYRAVLSTDAQEAKSYADQSIETSKLVDDAYPELSALVDPSPRSPDRQSLEKFRDSWEEYRKIQKRTLDSTAENAALKAREPASKDAAGSAVELCHSSNAHLDECYKAMMSLRDSLRDRLKNDLDAIRSLTQYTRWLMVAVPLIGILAGVVLAAVIARSIVEPMSRGVEISAAVARGDLTRRIGLTQRDEVGQLACAIDSAAAAFGKIVKEIQDTSQNIGGAAGELSSVSHQMLAQSEEMAAQANSVAGGTEQMTANVNTMAAAAEEMSMNVLAISSASEEISVNVGTISAAAENAARNVTAVSGAIRESTEAFEAISQDAREGSTIANKALAMADGANATMQGLDHSAAEIDKVTEAIKMIALQTNLLALNATIEATSAGEAGKGFAVVANEIKELAHQSAKAAEDIARKIEGVQANSREAVRVIGAVQDIIRTLNESSGRIAAAVEKQSAAAKISTGNLGEAGKGVEHIALSIAEVAKGAGDMSRNAGEAAQGASDVSRNAAEAAKAVGDISRNIHGVSQAARDNTAGAQQVNSAAERLAAIAGQLKQLVGRFKIEE